MKRQITANLIYFKQTVNISDKINFKVYALLVYKSIF